MPYFGSFRPQFEEAIVIFEISTFEFVKMQSFMLKEKKLNLEPRMLYLGIFGLEFENAIVMFEISTFEFVKMQSFMLKGKIKFGTKITLFGCFWTEI